jgi:predicted Zn-dependent protease
MANRGAPKGNKYAEKEGEGAGISIYLSFRDIAFLQRMLQERGEDPTKWRKFARQYAKQGIYAKIKAYMDAEII